MISMNHSIHHIVNQFHWKHLVIVLVPEAIPCDPNKIVAVVPCDVPDTTRPLAPIDDDAKQ